jgi:hypothetical protein
MTSPVPALDCAPDTLSVELTIEITLGWSSTDPVRQGGDGRGDFVAGKSHTSHEVSFVAERRLEPEKI